MKKLYSTPNLVKAVSLGAAMATLLSSVSPVFAANLSWTGGVNRSTGAASVSYPSGSHGSIVFAGDDDYCGADNVVGRGGQKQQSATSRITAEDQYNRFINGYTTSAGRNPYGTMTQQAVWQGEGLTSQNGGYMGLTTGGIIDALPEAFGIYSFATGCGSYATGNYSTAFGAGATTKAGGAQAFGVSALASGKASVAMGVGSEASGESAVAVGGLATASGKNSVALGVRTKASKEYTVAIGSQAEARASGAIAIGGSEAVEDDDGQDRFVIAYEKDAIAIGSNAHAAKMYSIAIGSNAQVRVKDGVAIGGGSVSLTDKGVLGYDPATDKPSTNNNITWKSTAGAFSVGEVGGAQGDEGQLTRQITGVAAGTEDTDAVNVAQLKALREVASGEWKLSVNGKNETSIKPNTTVDFSVSSTAVGKDNLKIEKDNKNNKNNVKFSLSDNLKLTSVTTGQSRMSDDGFVIDNGPKVTIDGFMFADENGPSMTIDGIDAGNKKIINVADATEGHEAVNYKQLNDVKDLISKAGGWKFSVNGEDVTDVNPGGTVDFVGVEQKGYDGRNIKIVKGKDNQISFDLNESVRVGEVLTENTHMNRNGFFITDGPNMTTGGIFAGRKQLKGVEKGTHDNDAVNVAQLNEVKDQIAENTLVKWDDGQKLITIGAQKGGTKIDITGSEGDRAISGVKAAVEDNEAVNKKQLDDTITEAADSIKLNILVKQDEENGPITVGKERGGTTINIANKSGDARTVSGVQAAENDDEAVNKKQLDGHIADITDIINNIKADNAFAVLYDKNDDDSVNYNKVILGGDKSQGPVALLNVKDGSIAEESHDAINGSQINKISKDIARFFGGGTEFNNGAFSGPQYNLSTVSTEGNTKQKVFEDVGSALTGLDANVKNVNSRLTHVSNEFNQKFDGISKDALLWSNEEQAFVALHGEGTKTNSKLTFLKDGDISEDSTDAINGSQLFDVAENISEYFGGSTDVHAGIKPAFLIGDQKYNDVTSAFTGVNLYIKNIDDKIIEMKENNLVQQEGGKSGTITIGAKTAGTEINIAGIGNAARSISGVKAAENDDEAVNKAQLDENIEKISKDALLWSEDDQAFVARHGEDGGKTNSKITYLLDGDINEESTDAINGSQINTIAEDIANYFGGGASFEDGAFKGPKYSLSVILEDGQVKKADYTNVGSALKGLDGNIQGVNNRLTNVSNEFNQKIEGITKDALLWSEDDQAFVARHGEDGGKTNSKITYLLDGDINEESTDAINGSQINTIAGDIANYFGGDASFEDGAFKGPKYSLSVILEDGQVGKANYRDVGSALKGLDGNIQGVNNRLTNVSNEFNQKIEGITKDALLWSEDEKAFVALHEKNGQKTNSKLKFLLDGDISKGSTDAITGNQLFLMSNQLAAYFGGGAKYENGQWTAPNFQIAQVDADGKIGEKKNYNNVAEAFDGVNNGMSNINNRIDDVIKKVDSDALKWNKNKKAYDAERNGKPSKITGVADGKIAEGSKDAVNGGQLWETNERITGVEKDVKHLDNRVTNISNTIADIGDTVLDIDAKVDDIDDRVNDIAEDAVRYDRDESGKKTNKITLVGGNPSEPVTIDKVADGKIASGSQQAVNGGQLHDYTKEQMKIVLDESKNYTDQRVNNIVIDAVDDAVERANNYTNMKFEALNYSIENVRKEARQAAAIGLAVSNLRYNDTPGKLSVGFGSGLWRSQSAFAFGAGYTSEKGNIRSNISVTTSGGHWGVGAGFNMTLN